jgi:hypothetical protein
MPSPSPRVCGSKEIAARIAANVKALRRSTLDEALKGEL